MGNDTKKLFSFIPDTPLEKVHLISFGTQCFPPQLSLTLHFPVQSPLDYIMKSSSFTKESMGIHNHKTCQPQPNPWIYG